MHLENNPAVSLLVAVLVTFAAVRVLELGIDRRHERRLLARGATRHGRDGLGAIVLAQAVLFAGLLLEGLIFGAPPTMGAATWVFLGLALLSLAIRHWCIHTLGDRWTIRVITLPGEPLVRRGPYRFLRHPNYVAVAVEAVALCLAFESWWTLAASVAVGAPALLYRIRREENALAPFRLASEPSQEAS